MKYPLAIYAADWVNLRILQSRAWQQQFTIGDGPAPYRDWAYEPPWWMMLLKYCVRKVKRHYGDNS